MSDELNIDSYKLTGDKILAVGLAALGLWFCFGAVALGYGFFGDIFGALKLGFCILSSVLCFRVFSKGILGPAVLCGLIALVYNPFFTLHLDEDSWRAVNFATAVGYLWAAWRFHQVSKVMTPERIEKMRVEEARVRLAQARATAIDEAIEKGDLDEKKI